MTQQMAPYVDEFIENRMGGFWCEKSKNPNAKRVMIAAHMDEIGFMITNITKNGMIQFTNLGGVANDIWQGQRLVIKIEMAIKLSVLFLIYLNIFVLVVKVHRKLKI